MKFIQGITIFDQCNIILFDYVNSDGYIQTIKYIKDEDKITASSFK